MTRFVLESFMFSGRKYKITGKDDGDMHIYNCLTCPLNLEFCRVSTEILKCKGIFKISYE